MRIVFAGPSLAGRFGRWSATGEAEPAAELVFRGPAAQGDVVRAVLDGAVAIGLIDGVFERVAAVWHKEILFALDSGVRVLGAASMGALRAAECAAYGMVGVGDVFAQYASGELEDDDAVAQLHAPAELGYRPLTEALVNSRATLDKLLDMDAISRSEAEAFAKAARATFFKERTLRNIVRRSGLPSRSRSAEILDLFARHAVNLKEQDARQLLDALLKLPAERGCRPTNWTFNETPMWRRSLQVIADGA